MTNERFVVIDANGMDLLGVFTKEGVERVGAQLNSDVTISDAGPGRVAFPFPETLQMVFDSVDKVAHAQQVIAGHIAGRDELRALIEATRDLYASYCTLLYCEQEWEEPE